MIRKLTRLDNDLVFPFITKESSKNLFIVGDIEIYGYDQDFQEVWGEFTEQGEVKAVLLRYYETFILYGLKGYNAKGFLKIIKGYKQQMISGAKEVLEELEPFISLEDYEMADTYFCECTRETFIKPKICSLSIQVKLAHLDDITRFAQLESEIPEFPIRSKEEQEMAARRQLENKAGRTFYIEDNNKFVSMASTTAENSQSAMIMGVSTHPDYRKKGYATTILNKVLEELLREKKALCLFYDNPDAGSIYKRLGFYDIGLWRMYFPKLKE